MLDLVVEPAAHVVGEFSAAVVVGRAHHLGHVKLLLAVVVEGEAVEIVGGVIGGDHEEGVDVGERLGEELVEKHVPSGGRSQGEECQRHQPEVEDSIREVTTQPQPPHRPTAEVDEIPDRKTGDVLVAQPLPAVGVEHAQRVGGVVDDLPGASQDRDEGEFHPVRQGGGAKRFHVPLGHVRVGILTGVVVVEEVVLMIPGRGEEPVEPVDKPAPAAGEHPARVAGGDPRHPVVAAVGDVMREQPAGHLPEAQGKGREGIGEDPGGGIPKQGGELAVRFNPPQVGKIGWADLSVGVGLEPLDVGAKPGDIHPSQVAKGRQWGNATVPTGSCLGGGFGGSHGSRGS